MQLRVGGPVQGYLKNQRVETRLELHNSIPSVFPILPVAAVSTFIPLSYYCIFISFYFPCSCLSFIFFLFIFNFVGVQSSFVCQTCVCVYIGTSRRKGCSRCFRSNPSDKEEFFIRRIYFLVGGGVTCSDIYYFWVAVVLDFLMLSAELLPQKRCCFNAYLFE